MRCPKFFAHSRLHSRFLLCENRCCDEPCFAARNRFVNPFTRPKSKNSPLSRTVFFRQFSLFCLVITSYNVKGYAAFHKTSTADAVSEVFCSLATSRSEKVPFSAVSTNLVSLRETGSLIPLPVPKAKTALFRGLFLSFGVGKGIRTFDLQCHKLAL